MFLSGLYVWKQVKKASAPWSERNVPEFFILILIFLIPLSIRLSKLRDNARENSVRPLALGRKNHLFCGNHDAAENAAIIYTFMGCCKLAQVDVRKWLSHFFTHIHEYDNDYSRDLMELLPHNLKQKGTLWHPLKILQDSWLIPRILENPTRFWKYLQYFRRNPAIRGITDGLRKTGITCISKPKMLNSIIMVRVYFTLLYIRTFKLKPKLTPQESIRFSFNWDKLWQEEIPIRL